MTNTENVTLEDLWPGDVIIARRPGGYYAEPHRFIDTRRGCDECLLVKVSSLDGEFQFEVFALDDWGTVVERYV